MKKNIILQTLYQILNTCLPLITAPYLARVMGAEQLGIFSFTSSIVAYFTLIAMMGTVNYGTRSISIVKENAEKRAEIFCSIYVFQFFTTLIALLSYVIYIIKFSSENQVITILQIIAIISCFLNIDWFFFGMENFKVTVTRGIIVKLITVTSIFLLVKSEKDLWLYTLIMLGGTLVSYGILWLQLPKYISLKRVTFEQVKIHIKPNLILFIPLLAMSVYHAMDKTMLGMLSTYEQCGYYYSSDKVINIPLCIVNGIGTVMLPRMTSLLSDSNRREYNKYFLISLDGIGALSIAASFGIAAVADEFIPLFYGQGYEPCILLTKIFAPIFVIKSFSVTIRTQYLIPMNREKDFVKSVVFGAVVNLICNLLFIPRFEALGAVIGTLLAELTACILQFLVLKEQLPFWRFMRRMGCYLIIGCLMMIIIRLIAQVEMILVVKLLLEIIVGIIIYGSLCLIFWKKTGNSFI